MKKFNPFRPGKIISPGMFAGRLKHLEALTSILHQTKNGNSQHFALVGERGIGKSSLLMVLQHFAEGGKPLEAGDPTFKFLVVNMDVEPNTSYIDIVRRAGNALQRTVAGKTPAKEFAKSAWEFLRRWQVFGVKYDAGSGPSSDPHEMLDELVDSVVKTLESMGGDVDGIVFLIDEADKPPSDASLGEFCKLFTERLTKRGCNRVCLGLAGLPVLFAKLRESHESAPRIFETMTLEPLQPDDRARAIQRGLNDAAEKNGFATSMAADARALIVDLSEGYPHFIQQFAYSAFDADTDNTIDVADVNASMPHAIHQLGISYFHDLYFDKIASDDYRAVLHAMSAHGDGWVNKDEIRASAGIKETQLTNALATLKSRNIIVSQDGKRGVYRLPTKAFAVWLKARNQAPGEATIPP